MLKKISYKLASVPQNLKQHFRYEVPD